MQLAPEPTTEPGVSTVKIPSQLLERGIDVDVSMQNMEEKDKRWSWTTATICAVKKVEGKATQLLLHVPAHKTRFTALTRA
jgi:hypothetical protein